MVKLIIYLSSLSWRILASFCEGNVVSTLVIHLSQEFMETKDNVSLVTDGKSYKLLAEALKIFKQHDIDGSGKR